MRFELAEQVVEPRHRSVRRFVDGEGDRSSGERGEDALVSLPWQLTIAWLAERCAGPGGCFAEQRVEARAADQQQAVCRPGAGDCEPAERRVEVVERGSASQRVDRDSQPVRLPLPRVDGRGDEVLVGLVVALAEAVHYLLGVVHGLVASGEDGNKGIAVVHSRGPDVALARRIRILAVRGTLEGEAVVEKRIEERLDVVH